MRTVPWIVLSVVLAAIGILLNHESGQLRAALEEYEINEEWRMLDECERCKLNEESHWKNAAKAWRDYNDECEADLRHWRSIGSRCAARLAREHGKGETAEALEMLNDLVEADRPVPVGSAGSTKGDDDDE